MSDVGEHLICEHCWFSRMKAEGTPERQPPWRVLSAPRARCCFCAFMTDSGIYVREANARMSCNHTIQA